MRSRSIVFAGILFLVGLVNLAAALDLFVTKLVAGDALSYLWMVVDGLSAVGCVVAVVAIRDRRKRVTEETAIDP